MTNAKSRRKGANDSKTTTGNGLKRTTARKAGQLKSIAKPAAHQGPRPTSQPTTRHASKKATSLRTSERIRDKIGASKRKKLGLNLVSANGANGRIYRIIDRAASRQRSAMRSRRPVAKKTTRMSLDAGPPQVSEKEVQAAEVQVAAEDMTDRFGLVRDDCDLSLRAPGGATIEAMARPAPGLVRTTPARKPRTEWDCHFAARAISSSNARKPWRSRSRRCTPSTSWC